ncbi:YacL family protein [Marinobacterium sp. AK62]|uniref:YacL family protein n=1 Tax=Marinobacterium alkalitolerans TaxID=1542925 RepID=A0ABS3Z7N4_9GAMM|nr:YacL family protein [Marinobacterium alkalitolerans]MBP0047248.1 YacL family protein [Marinobacterium alkalitolerans]
MYQQGGIAAMEYEFRQDLYGQPEAIVELEQALFGRWLGEALGADLAQAEALLKQALSIQQTRRGQHVWHGRELSLQLDTDSARVWLHAEDEASLLDEGFGWSDAEAEAGLDDFIELLQGWMDYIRDCG